MNQIPIFPQTASVQEMQKSYRKLLDRVRSTKNPLFILRNNVPEVVIVDVSSWSNIVERLIDKEYKEARVAIKSFQKERKERKLKTLKKSLSDLIK